MTTPDPRTAPRAAAVAYRARGWAPLPLPRPGKRPQLADWPAFTLTDEALDAHFPPGRDVNLGLLLGDRSGGLVDVDLDCPEAVAAAPVLLPPTGMTTGRAGGPSHYWYVVPDPPRKAAENFDDPTRADDARHLLELRSTGGQTVVPPSVYPPDPARGRPAEEACVFHRAGDPPRVARPDLAAAVRATAAAALLARHWPTGARNRLAQAVAGGLLRAGWAADRAQTFLRAVAVAARDEEVENRVRTVGYTADRLARNEPAIGWPVAETILGAHGAVLVSQIREWLGVRIVGTEPGTGPAKPGKPAPPKPPTPPIPEYVPFPTHLLPPVVRDYVESTAAAMNCDRAYSALPALAALGAAIGASHAAGAKRRWKEPPYIWAVAIGKSGAVKSPPFRDVEEMAEDINDRLEQEYELALEVFQQKLQDWEQTKRDGGAAGAKPKEPVERAFVKGDVTIEALVGTLQDNPRGLLVGQDELSAWIGGFVKHTGKTGTSDLPRWLQLSNAGSINYTRKTGDRRKVRVRGVGVSVAGTIQPRILARVLTEEFRASGFLARLRVAMPPWKKRVWVEAEDGEEIRADFRALLNTLFELPPASWPDGKPAPHLVRLSDEAKDLFVAFYNANGAALEVADEDMSAVMSKLEGYALRFALIFHCCRLKEYAGTARITAADMQAAIGLTMWFRDEAERVYLTLGESDETKKLRHLFDVVSRLADRRFARKGPPRGITTRDLQKHNARLYPSHEHAELALEWLVTAGMGVWEDAPVRPGGGHRSRVFVPRQTSDTSDTWSDDEDDDDGGASDTRSDTRSGPPEGGSAENGTNGGPEQDLGQPATPAVEGECLKCRTSDEVGGDPNAPAAPSEDKCPTEGECPTSADPGYTPVTSREWIGAVVAAVEDGGAVAVDCETTGLDPVKDRVRLLQLATGRGTFILDLFRLPPADLGPVFNALAGVEVIGHNLQFDLRFLARYGFTPGRVFDTMLASQVLRAGERGSNCARLSHKLGDVAARELGREMDKTHQTADWSKALTPAMLAYAAADVDVLRPLADTLRAQLDAAGLTPTVELEMRALPGISAAPPMCVDVAAWTALAARAEDDVRRLDEEMTRLAPDAADLFGSRNWNSPPQVTAAFAALGVTLASTADGVLAQVDHPLATLLREYRGATKRVGTYGRTWVKKHAPDGFVSTSWNQMGAASGRMSSAAPNLQQIPRGSDYRRCFTARPGHLLVKADYSQIELRIAAKVANEAVMIEAYRSGRDLHRLTASQVLGRPEAELSKDDRQVAKSLNFGLLYGMGWKSLRAYALASYGVTLTDAQARDYRASFFRTYPGLRSWHRREQDRVDRLFRADPAGTHEVRTLAGRRPVLPMAKRRGDGTSYPNLTEALNTPVQGTGADGLKAAVGLLWERRAECPAAVPVLFCHDEIVLDVPATDAGPAADWLRRCMVEAVAGLLDPVPVEVEVCVGRTWGG